jgi:hypothetical protein
VPGAGVVGRGPARDRQVVYCKENGKAIGIFEEGINRLNLHLREVCSCFIVIQI